MEKLINKEFDEYYQEFNAMFNLNNMLENSDELIDSFDKWKTSDKFSELKNNKKYVEIVIKIIKICHYIGKANRITNYTQQFVNDGSLEYDRSIIVYDIVGLLNNDASVKRYCRYPNSLFDKISKCDSKEQQILYEMFIHKVIEYRLALLSNNQEDSIREKINLELIKSKEIEYNCVDIYDSIIKNLEQDEKNEENQKSSLQDINKNVTSATEKQNEVLKELYKKDVFNVNEKNENGKQNKDNEKNDEGNIAQAVIRSNEFDNLDYLRPKDEKIKETVLVLGDCMIENEEIRAISELFGFDKENVTIWNDYNKITNATKKLENNTKYSVIICGPTPHSASGMGNENSLLESLKNGFYAYTVAARDSCGRLKISKSSLKNAFKEARNHFDLYYYTKEK